jgi:tight adherence protein B
MLGHTRLWRLYHRTLTRAGLNAHAEAWAQWYVLGALLLLLTASAASSPALAVILLAALTVTLAMLLSGAVDRAHQQLREQLPQMLDALVAALRAGLSFPQAIDTVTADTQGRMHEILQNLQADLAVGRDLGRAFQAAATASELREFTFVATAAAVVSRVGGDAPQLFENCAALVRQDLALNRSLKAQTAQGRLSVRMIAIVPAILIAIMSCAMPGYLGVWLHSTVGRVAFAFALLLLLTGFLWVRRVVRVDV